MKVNKNSGVTLLEFVVVAILIALFAIALLPAFVGEHHHYSS